MDSGVVITVFAVLASLSLAAERLVEILKNSIPLLQKEKSSLDSNVRRALVEALSVGAGILTAWLAWDAISTSLPDIFQSVWSMIALGLLASGGSAMWNSLLKYAIAAKNLKIKEAIAEKSTQ